MQKIKILELPYLSSAFIDEPKLCTDGGELRLSMHFDDEGEKRSTMLRFVNDRAFRQRAEIYCTAWHFENTLDTVCEVQDSDWVKELRDISERHGQYKWILRHFIIFLEDVGCLEVVAESVVFDDYSRNSAGT